jgi:hypothetical protein
MCFPDLFLQAGNRPVRTRYLSPTPYPPKPKISESLSMLVNIIIMVLKEMGVGYS